MRTVKSKASRKPGESRGKSSAQIISTECHLSGFLKSLGNISARRVLMVPPPTRATEADLLKRNDRLSRSALYELVAGTLVEKPTGQDESYLAGIILTWMNAHVLAHGLGFVFPGDGPHRFARGLVRLPDVSFVSRTRFPGGVRPRDPILPVAPDLAVEILSRCNTKAEIDRKISEYLDAGVRLVWIIDPQRRTARVHRAGGDVESFDQSGTLDADGVIPGFRLDLKALFALV